MNEQEIMNEIHDLDKPRKRKPEEIKHNLVKGIRSNTAYIIGFTILIVATLAFFNDFNVQTAAGFQKLSVTVFFIAFCSYSMYINFSQKGVKDGKLDELYVKVSNENAELSQRFIEKGYMLDLPEFCDYWVTEELKNARLNILKSISIDYNTYLTEYIDLDESRIKELKLSDKCKNALIQANSTKPLQLSSDDIVRNDYALKNRKNPIGRNPQAVKKIDNITRLARTLFTSIGSSLIVLDALAEASFNSVAEALVKLLTIALNGYTGYRRGYDNIAVYSSSWLQDKNQKINEASKWIEAKRNTPKEPETIKSTHTGC